MACERFADELKAHAAGADPSRRLRAHLEACAACRGRLARERKLVAGIERDLAGALRVQPSVEFEARIRQRVAQEDPRIFVGSRSGRIFTSRFALAAASLLLVAGLAIVFTLRAGGTRPTSTAGRPDATTRTPVAPPHGASTTRPVEEPRNTATADAGTSQLPHTTRVRHVAGGLRGRPKATTEPEVLVPPDQRLAINRLLEMIRTGKIDERAFPPAAGSEVAPPSEQVVAPLVVEDLKVPPIDLTAAASSDKKEHRIP